MRDEDKTREQLIEELNRLRDELATRGSESAITEQWEQFLAIMDNFPEVLYVVDPRTYRVELVNRAFAEALGGDPAGKLCYEVFQGLEEPCSFCTNEIILKERKPYAWEYHNPVLDRTFAITDQIIRWPDGREMRFEVAVDITERKRAEEELQIKEIFFESAITANSTSDAQGIINQCNPAFLKLWGYDSKEEAIGNSVGSFFVNEADAGPVLQALATTGRWEGEFLARRKDGSTFISRGYAAALRDGQGEVIGYQSANLDVTAQRTAEQGLQRALADLERSNRELEQFAYVASHDLQEPLRMISSYTQLLARRYKDKLDQDAEEFIGFAVDGANRMQRLINDLLAYSRVTTRGKPPEPTDSHAALGEAIKNLAATIDETGAIVTNDDLPTVRADHSQLVRLLQNLIGNAIKFCDDGPRVHVSARRDEENGSWVFSVRDNGIGIDPDYHERIFVIFQHLHPKGRYQGTGIGLAVCKRIVERHGGRIWLESSEGQGSTFHFTLERSD
jgi:PAS domain S-box-containing protein